MIRWFDARASGVDFHFAAFCAPQRPRHAVFRPARRYPDSPSSARTVNVGIAGILMRKTRAIRREQLGRVAARRVGWLSQLCVIYDRHCYASSDRTLLRAHSRVSMIPSFVIKT